MTVDPEEWVLRRVHKTFCTSGPETEVLRGGFTPNKSDTTGVSLYLESALADNPEAAAKVVRDAAKKPDECYVVRVQVKELLALGFTLQPDDDPDGPQGHHVIPELALDKYKNASNPGTIKGKIDELARAASRNIVLKPPNEEASSPAGV
jgi:hypothetical protein